jgi:SHS2 domain-containing protein
VLPHPADVGLAFWAPTRVGAFEEAARGLLQVLGVRPAAPAAGVQVQRWRVEGVDDVEQLFKLLAQLLWAAATPAGPPADVRVTEGPGKTLEVEAAGVGVRTEVSYGVQAVTYQGMAFGLSRGGWAGRAYFDL